MAALSLCVVPLCHLVGAQKLLIEFELGACDSANNSNNNSDGDQNNKNKDEPPLRNAAQVARARLAKLELKLSLFLSR